MKLHLASGNAHKAREFQALADAGALRGALEIVPARAPGGMPRVEEDTGTFAGNAEKKARALREKLLRENLLHEKSNAACPRPPPLSGQPRTAGPSHETWVLADDSGLCVDALGGGPGVESAYYAGPQGDSAANLAKLVRVMRNVPDTERGAHFKCVLLLIAPDGAAHTFEGRCPGRLAREPRGGSGFGYDPLFIPEGQTRTFSELSEAVKNKLSHRGRAWIEMARYLETLIRNT
jgi:XTP/dITP diphosphohydrolase